MCDLSDTPVRSATGRFLPGRSGNPAGRPLGARNKASLLAEMIDEAASAAIVRTVVDRALAGDWPALRLCFTRLVAPKKEAPVEFDLPSVATLTDVADAGAALLAAVAAGEITPGEGQKIMALLSAQIRILTAAEHAREKATPAGRAATTASPSAAAAMRPESRTAPSEARAPAAAPCISPVPSAVEGPGLSDVEGPALGALAACNSPVFADAAQEDEPGTAALPRPSDPGRLAGDLDVPEASPAGILAQPCISPVLLGAKPRLLRQAPARTSFARTSNACRRANSRVFVSAQLTQTCAGLARS